jgi:V/A-type H+-transporting ATPase subunit F
MAKKEQSQPMAAIGEYETVLPFQAVGVKPMVLTEDNRADFPSILRRLANEKYAVVFIQEQLYLDFKENVDEINEEYALSILPIPGFTGSMGTGVESIRNSVERAVGMDIFSVK